MKIHDIHPYISTYNSTLVGQSILDLYFTKINEITEMIFTNTHNNLFKYILSNKNENSKQRNKGGR